MDDFLACLAGRSRRLPARACQAKPTGGWEAAPGRAAPYKSKKGKRAPTVRASRQRGEPGASPVWASSPTVGRIRSAHATSKRRDWRQSKQAAYLAVPPPDAVSVIVAKLASQDDDPPDSAARRPDACSRPSCAVGMPAARGLSAAPRPMLVRGIPADLSPPSGGNATCVFRAIRTRRRRACQARHQLLRCQAGLLAFCPWSRKIGTWGFPHPAPWSVLTDSAWLGVGGRMAAHGRATRKGRRSPAAVQARLY